MLRLLAVFPFALPTRAPADGGGGTLGHQVVGAHEVRPGSVPFDRLVDLPGAGVLGREAGAGPVEVLDPPALRGLLAEGAAAVGRDTLAEAAASALPGAAALITAGRLAPGDGGGAVWLRAAAEPAHPGKFADAAGQWWELSAQQTVTPQIFGARGDGTHNDTAAFDDAIAYCRVRRVRLDVPAGDYLLDALAPIIRDVGGGPGVPRDEVCIRGAGRAFTRLIYSGPLSGPLLRCTPSAANKLGGFDLSHLTIDGAGHAGVAVRLSHMSKCIFAHISIRDVADIGFQCDELWDSTFLDVYLHRVGTVTPTRPSMRFVNRVAADADSSCNNIGFYDLHVEEHPFRAIEILDGARKLTFVRLKCHHNPGAWPPPGTDHVVIDGRNVASGPGYMISFLGVHLAVSSGSGIVLRNTGGAPGAGFHGVDVTGGSIQGQLRYGIRAENVGGLSVSGTSIRNSGLAAIYAHEDAHGLAVDWATVEVDPDKPAVLHQGPGMSEPQPAARVQAGAAAIAGGHLVVDAPAGAPDAVLETIHGGAHGRRLTLCCLSADRPITVRQSATGNIRTQGGADRVLDHPEDVIQFLFDPRVGRWLEVGFSDAAP